MAYLSSTYYLKLQDRKKQQTTYFKSCQLLVNTFLASQKTNMRMVRSQGDWRIQKHYKKCQEAKQSLTLLVVLQIPNLIRCKELKISCSVILTMCVVKKVRKALALPTQTLLKNIKLFQFRKTVIYYNCKHKIDRFVVGNDNFVLLLVPCFIIPFTLFNTSEKK